MNNQQLAETVAKLERTSIRLETLVEGLEERQKRFDDHSERLVILEERERVRDTRLTRLAGLWGTLISIVVGLLVKCYDVLTAHHSAH